MATTTVTRTLFYRQDDGLPKCSEWLCQVCKRHNVRSISKCKLCGTSRLYRRGHSKLDADVLEYKNFEDLDIGEIVGEGSFGAVHIAFSRTSGSAFAVKQFTEPQSKECEFMRDLRHPRLVRYFDHGEKFLVTEFLAGGELLSRLLKRGKYSEEKARLATWQVLDALHYLHGKGIAHCDIKLENILLKSARNDIDIKLCDFGLAQRYPIAKCGPVAATPEYAAPSAEIKFIFRYSAT